MEEKIIDKFDTTNIEGNIDYQVNKTNITREVELFAIIPIWIENKFHWLKRIKVLERKYYSRRKEFDSGWRYTHYWSEWKEEWRKEKIIN